MDLDHLKKLVDASIEECETTNDTGKAYDELLAYIDSERVPSVARELAVLRPLAEAAHGWAHAGSEAIADGEMPAITQRLVQSVMRYDDSPWRPR